MYHMILGTYVVSLCMLFSSEESIYQPPTNAIFFLIIIIIIIIIIISSSSSSISIITIIIISIIIIIQLQLSSLSLAVSSSLSSSVVGYLDMKCYLYSHANIEVSRLVKSITAILNLLFHSLRLEMVQTTKETGNHLPSSDSKILWWSK